MIDVHLQKLVRFQNWIIKSCCNIYTCLINCGSTDDISVKKKKKDFHLDPNIDLD